MIVPLLIAAVAIAQQPPLAEKIEVSVVNVDVAVTGADGQPVRGLSAGDFEIFDDGRRQTITNFYVVEKGVEAGPSAGQYRPEGRYPHDAFRRKVLVLVDVFHTTKNRRALALANLERMIDDSFRTGEYDWSIGVLGRGVTMVLPLTSDKAAIHNTFARMIAIGERRTPSLTADIVSLPQNPDTTKPNFQLDTDALLDQAMSFDEQDRILRARFTTQAIIDSVRGFASTSGKKIVLLLTGDSGLNDLEVTIDNFGPRGGAFFQRPLTPDFGRRQQQITDLRESIVREANASGVTLYIFNTEGLQPGGDFGAISAERTNTAAVFWLSKDTGGRLVTGNDGAAALRQFDTASSNYYSLGYRSPHGDDGKYHSITVHLKNVKGAKLEYRSGYSSNPTEVQLARAMESPVAGAMLPKALPVTLTTGAVQPDRRGVAVPISIKVPFSSLQFLPAKDGSAAHVRIFVSVFDDIGKRLFSGSFPLSIRSADPNGVMVYKNAVVLSKGVSSQIVAAVRDETTESVGAAEINVTPH